MRTTIDVGGRDRTMTVVGSEDGRAGRDLVLVLHGSKQTGEQHRAFTGHQYDDLAAGEGAVVANLDGYRGNWNDARRQSAFPARLEGVDDVGFVRAAVASLTASHRIDPDRVFVVGYSNGGQMVMRLVHEVPDLLAGTVVIAATMPTPDSFVETEAPVAPVRVLVVHGTKDPIAPFGGGAMRPWVQRVFRVGGTTRSAPDTAAYFAERNGIDTVPTTSVRGVRGSAVWTEQTDHVQPGARPVRLLAVHGGGHTVPGPKRAPIVLGRTERSWSVAGELVDFLGVRADARENH